MKTFALQLCVGDFSSGIEDLPPGLQHFPIFASLGAATAHRIDLMPESLPDKTWEMLLDRIKRTAAHHFYRRRGRAMEVCRWELRLPKMGGRACLPLWQCR